MAFRTWAKLLAATLGVAALAGASQLGLVYGLGIVRLTRVLDVTARDQWTAQLAWVAWMAMLAAVVGALAGASLMRRWAPTAPAPGPGTELALAFSAAIGAGVVVPLTMQPARTAQVAGVDPVVVIAICAGLGALVGVFAAWAALAQAVARWSLVTMGAAVWAVALVSVAPSLAPGDPLPAVRLGVFDAGFLSPAVTQRTALATMPALALVIGALLGWTARRRGLPTMTIALAGLAGPALLTIAYLIAGPGAGTDRYQVVPYWAAMTAAGAGVLGSVLAAVVRRGPQPQDEDDSAGQSPEKPPLPRRTNQPDSAIAAAGAPTAGDHPQRPGDTGVFDRPQRGRPGNTPGSDDGPSSAPRAEAVAAGLGGPTASASLGRPAPAAAEPEKSPRGRRSSVADAFIGRTGDVPAAPPRSGATTAEPFDAFPRSHRHEPPGSGAAPWSTATATDAPPYVPEPATRPLPPGVGTSTGEQPRPAGGRLGRGLRPFGRGKGAEPLTPEPTPISAPLPQPEPVTPPLAVIPAPRGQAAPSRAGQEPEGRRKPRNGNDGDYVDWVSGLGQ
jgi:hypothetical protein